MLVELLLSTLCVYCSVCVEGVGLLISMLGIKTVVGGIGGFVALLNFCESSSSVLDHHCCCCCCSLYTGYLQLHIQNKPCLWCTKCCSCSVLAVVCT